jgi:hypothetical protein
MRIAGEQRERLVAQLRAAYEAGQSVRPPAAETGRSYGWVYRLLTDSGVTFRGRGGAHGRRRQGHPVAAGRYDGAAGQRDGSSPSAAPSTSDGRPDVAVVSRATARPAPCYGAGHDGG